MTTNESSGRSPISTRPVSKDDEQFLLELYCSTRADEFVSLGWEQFQLEALLKMQFEAQRGSYRLHYPKAEQRIIQDTGRDIGQLIVDRSEGQILLVDISIMPGDRSRGFGTLILNDLLNEARSRGDSVLLHVLRDSRAVDLYSRLGFSQTGENDTHLEMVWGSDAP